MVIRDSILGFDGAEDREREPTNDISNLKALSQKLLPFARSLTRIKKPINKP